MDLPSKKWPFRVTQKTGSPPTLKRRTRLLVPPVFLGVGLLILFTHLNLPSNHIDDPQGATAEARVHPFGSPKPIPRLLGAQVLVFTCESYAQVEKAIRGLAQAGVNTLIVRAFQNRGDRIYRFASPKCRTGVYFQTTHAPVVDAVLGRIVTLAHRHGLRVFAWMETRKTPLDISRPAKAKAVSYCFKTESYTPGSSWSIFDPTVESRLVGLYQDVVKTGVDGILIQDDLIMYHNEDFSSKATARFLEETGKRLDPKALYGTVFQDAQGHWCVPEYSETFWLWASWKNEQLLRLARKLILAAKAENPDISVAMNFMYESVTAPRNALAWLSQSLAEATTLPIDYFAIMAYHRQIRKELQLSEEAAYNKVAHMTNRLLEWIEDPHQILMKVQMTDWKTRQEIPPYEANQVFRRINQQGRVSLAFIPYSPTLPLNIIGHHYR